MTAGRMISTRRLRLSPLNATTTATSGLWTKGFAKRILTGRSKKKKWSKGKVKDRANNAVVLDKPTL